MGHARCALRSRLPFWLVLAFCALAAPGWAQDEPCHPAQAPQPDHVGSFWGLNYSGFAKSHLYQTGPYDKPVIIPAPFDPGQTGDHPLNAERLYGRLTPFLSRILDRGYDVW